MSIALDRLLKLPEVFSLHDLSKDTFNMASLRPETAKKFVLRMCDRGYIQPAGPRTGYYYNLVKDSMGYANRKLEVAELMYPEAIVIGHNVLHNYGWITQIPRTFDVAIDGSRRSVAQIDGVSLRRRNADWFACRQEDDSILRYGESPFYIDSLTPRAALEDIRIHQDMWVPERDDLFIPDDDDEGIERLEQPSLRLTRFRP